jgi:hypothetical protein
LEWFNPAAKMVRERILMEVIGEGVFLRLRPLVEAKNTVPLRYHLPKTRPGSKNAARPKLLFLLVPEVGLEPTRGIILTGF